MKTTYLASLLGSVILALLCTVAWADESRTETLRFAKGATGTSVTGNITGYNSVNYKVTAKAGQQMEVKLSTGHTATYFNVYAPGSGPGDAAIFIGSTSGNHFTATLPANGTYTIQVFMMRSAARRNESADYKLRVDIDNEKSSNSSENRGRGSMAWDFDATGITGG